MRRLVPDPIGPVDPEEEYAIDAELPWHVRASFISSVDGAVTVQGRSGGLGGEADRAVFALLRDLSDTILVGAGTARAEGYQASRPRDRRRDRRLRNALPTAPVLALVSERLDLDTDGGLFPADEPRTIVITSHASPARRRAELAERADVLVHGTDSVDLRVALAELRGRGLRRVHCEGGPRLFAGMVAAGLVDELCLTVAPLLTGPGADRIVTGPGTGPPVDAEPGPVLEQDGYLFLRYRLRPPQG